MKLSFGGSLVILKGCKIPDEVVGTMYYLVVFSVLGVL